MDSKHLGVSSSVPAIVLHGSAEIMVGPGEHRYYIYQAQPDEQQYIFTMNHPGSRVFITGLVLAKHEEKPLLRIELRHNAADTEAETLVKTVVKDKAEPRFEGLIFIEKDQTACASFLNHHSLLLSPTAKSWTRPSLEINNDNVRCSHAATIRHIKDRDILYARAHGLSKDEARQMYIDAFIEEVREDRMPKRLS